MKDFLKYVLIGFFIGIICGLFASGGGLLLIPILVKFLNLSEKQSRATSIFCILPLVITTSLFYNSKNYIDYKIGLLCTVGGIIGSFLGSKILKKIKDKYLKLIFSFFLLYVGIKIIFFS